ncbi:MAG: winged helix-turn-helix domain-containing protein [Hyphomonadaceae bacterium]
MIYEFENFELDTDMLELRHEGVARSLEPQVFELIKFLIVNRHRLVSKDDLQEHVWNGRFISDSVINSRLSTARALLDDDGKTQRLIKTHHRQGFRFIGDVTEQPLENLFGRATKQDLRNKSTEELITPSVKPSIAILPFHLIGIAGPHAAITDALPYEIISELSRARWLKVIARGSSFRFREINPDIISLGRTLGVRYCLTGIIEITGKQINVIVEVAETEHASIVWSQQFKSDIDGVHEIREKITSNVEAALEVHIPINEARRARLKPVENLDAWGLYHLGLQHLYRFTREENDQAAGLFRKAVALEPNFARAHAALSSTEYYNARTHYTDEFESSSKRCREHAEKSVAIDPLDPFANYAMGRSYTAIGDLETSTSWYDRTLDLRPNYAQCLYSTALTDILTELANHGREHIDDALVLSPLDPFLCAMHSVRAFSHIINEEYEEAAAWGEKAMATPNVHPHYACVPLISHTLNGDMGRANVWRDKLRVDFPKLSHHHFFASFPFQNGKTREQITQAFLLHS